jgi:hypothetical protein
MTVECFNVDEKGESRWILFQTFPVGSRIAYTLDRKFSWIMFDVGKHFRTTPLSQGFGCPLQMNSHNVQT